MIQWRNPIREGCRDAKRGHQGGGSDARAHHFRADFALCSLPSAMMTEIMRFDLGTKMAGCGGRGLGLTPASAPRPYPLPASGAREQAGEAPLPARAALSAHACVCLSPLGEAKLRLSA